MNEGMDRRVRMYLRANTFLEHLKKSRMGMTAQEFSALRNMALTGDIEGAWRGLHDVLASRDMIARRDTV